jgi:nicotinamidase-related amidase
MTTKHISWNVFCHFKFASEFIFFKKMRMKTLLIIDMQNDFLPGGALAVPEGDEVISVINKVQANYDLVVATQDWHPEKHGSFASVHETFLIIDGTKPVYKDGFDAVVENMKQKGAIIIRSGDVE